MTEMTDDGFHGYPVLTLSLLVFSSLLLPCTTTEILSGICFVSHSIYGCFVRNLQLLFTLSDSILRDLCTLCEDLPVSLLCTPSLYDYKKATSFRV